VRRSLLQALQSLAATLGLLHRGLKSRCVLYSAPYTVRGSLLTLGVRLLPTACRSAARRWIGTDCTPHRMRGSLLLHHTSLTLNLQCLSCCLLSYRHSLNTSATEGTRGFYSWRTMSENVGRSGATEELNHSQKNSMAHLQGESSGQLACVR
jgi:hypothetical protein